MAIRADNSSDSLNLSTANQELPTGTHSLSP